MDLLEHGPGPGPDYAETEHGHDWSASTARAMEANLVGLATALQANPLGKPPS